jgi:hypothetical protein
VLYSSPAGTECHRDAARPTYQRLCLARAALWYGKIRTFAQSILAARTKVAPVLRSGFHDRGTVGSVSVAAAKKRRAGCYQTTDICWHQVPVDDPALSGLWTWLIAL